MPVPNPHVAPALSTTRAFLSDAEVSGKLGPGPRESRLDHEPLRAFLVTLPWAMLLLQLLWSSAILGLAYVLGLHINGRNFDTLGDSASEFWTTRLNVPSSVVYAVGWALFVLLGFYIRDSTKRNHNATKVILRVGHHARLITTNVLYTCPAGTWHPGDIDRIVRHVIAYPIALKMQLRGERSREQLVQVLHPQDADDVLHADVMHVHCSRVVRAYIQIVDDRVPFWPSKYVDAANCPTGWASGFNLAFFVDMMDHDAQQTIALSEFRSSQGYVNHLRIFMYIWMMFLPLALIRSSGWFTPLWAVLVTHAIGMLFNIASALNDPFGFDIHDIKLNRLSATAAMSVLDIYMDGKVTNDYLVDEAHETPTWLDDAYAKKVKTKSDHLTTDQAAEDEKLRRRTANSKALFTAKRREGLFKWKPELYIPMVVFLAWCLFIVFLTWGLTRDDPRAEGVRWWDTYIPLDSSTVSYVSLGIFLLLGFWMSDAYGRYWGAIELWQAGIPSNLNDLLLYIPTTLRAGLWHERDHERLLSFLAALPYVMKQQLCHSADESDLDGILSTTDIARIKEQKNPTQYVFNVLKAYVYASDSTINVKIDPHIAESTNGLYVIALGLRAIEDQFFECMALQQIPIPHAFTSHLYLFTVFWLALLPLVLVLHDGFVSFLYLVPVGYSIINLLVVGKEMSDPFGTDAHDLPLDQFCEEMKESVRKAYISTRDGPKSFIVNTGYDREKFSPLSIKSSSQTADNVKQRSMSGPTPVSSIRTILYNFPSVSPFSVVASLAWSVIAVFVSKALADQWDEDRRNACLTWCSPIDVQGGVLANIGFALFFILGFRAADAINRYDTGAELLQSMRMRLRSFALDILMYFEDAEFHAGDKERAIAHAAQVPLCFRDMMLGRRDSGGEVETLLNEEDYERYVSAHSPIEYLLQTMSSYIAIQDVNYRDLIMDNGRYGAPAITFTLHVQALRNIIAKAYSIKRFPVIKSYTNQQHLFTAIWLLLLPLSMTSQTGYYTILWAPLISYGVLCLESIAVKLVDPYGTDDIDLPVNDICNRAAAEVVQFAQDVNWGCDLARPSPVDTTPLMETIVRERSLTVSHKFISFEDDKAPTECDDDSTFDSFAPMPKPKPTLYAHLLRSVPWWTLCMVTAWTAVGCLISFLSRDQTKPARWWVSNFSVGTSVGTYLSFLSFTLLGFYVNEAFERYHTAGNTWDYSLRKGCHLVANYVLTGMTPNAVHHGDQKRIIAHIAALPLVLKAELRESRDLREASGLLSNADLGLIQKAPSMSRHCLDVILTYWCAYAKNDVESRCKMGQLSIGMQNLRYELVPLEMTVNKAIFVKNFPIAPGFVIMLNSLLGIFFLVLPFILADVSGWLSILWVAIVAYGVLGMYKVAGELQDPYGTDLNDLDLDSMADCIAREVLFVYKQQQSGHTSLMHESKDTPQFWKQKSSEQQLARNVFNEYDTLAWKERMLYGLKTGLSAVPIWVIAVCTAWTAIAVLISYLISENLPQTNGNDGCEWFCSAIAISSSVISYVGFVLFLLLGFFLYDSHWRYVHGLELWRTQITSMVRLTANRMFQAYYPGFWHDDDFERIAGHLAAFVITLKGDLQGRIDKKRLSKVLCDDDVSKLVESPDKVNYCFDVVRSYLMHSDLTDPDVKKRQPVAINEMALNAMQARNTGNAAFQCRTIISIPLPFGYIQHLRIFLAIWLILFPFSIVESTGWISVLWMAIISYGIVGIDRWAEKLSDPFGDDITDLPLDEMADDIVDTVKETLMLFENNLDQLIFRDRKAVTVIEEKSDANGAPCAGENV